MFEFCKDTKKFIIFLEGRIWKMWVFYLISLPLTLGMVVLTLKYFSGPDVPRYVFFTVGYTWFCSIAVIVLVPADIWTVICTSFPRILGFCGRIEWIMRACVLLCRGGGGGLLSTCAGFYGLISCFWARFSNEFDMIRISNQLILSLILFALFVGCWLIWFCSCFSTLRRIVFQRASLFFFPQKMHLKILAVI